MLIRRIDHTAVYVRDLELSIEWYQNTFGLACAYHGDIGGGEPGAFFDVGDTILAMLLSRHPDRDLAEQHFAFAVDNADQAYADLISRGCTPLAPPQNLTGGYIAGQRFFEVHDPDGVRIELVERNYLTIGARTLHPGISPGN